VQHLKRTQTASVLLLEIIFFQIDHVILSFFKKKNTAGKTRESIGHATMRNGACLFLFSNQKLYI